MIDIDLLLAWGGAYKKVKAGEVIFVEGQICSFYNQLVDGKVKWVNINEEGKECIHRMVEADESFGELPLFDDGFFAATAIASEDSILIRLHKPTFLQLLIEYPQINFAFSQLLAKRLRYKFEVINAISAHCPEIIITTLLNQLKRENKNFCSKCHLVKLTRQQIAGMTGLRVETVIRTMRQMQEKGNIKIIKGKVFYGDMIQLITA